MPVMIFLATKTEISRSLPSITRDRLRLYAGYTFRWEEIKRRQVVRWLTWYCVLANFSQKLDIWGFWLFWLFQLFHRTKFLWHRRTFAQFAASWRGFSLCSRLTRFFWHRRTFIQLVRSWRGFPRCSLLTWQGCWGRFWWTTTPFFSGLWRRCFFRRTSALHWYLVFSPNQFLAAIDECFSWVAGTLELGRKIVSRKIK